MLDGNVWQSEQGEKSGFPEMRDSDGGWGSGTPLTSSVFGSTLLSRIWRPAAAINDCWLVELGTRLGKELENQGEKNSPRRRKGRGEISRDWKKRSWECMAEGVSNVSCQRCGYSPHSGG